MLVFENYFLSSLQINKRQFISDCENRHYTSKKKVIKYKEK